MISITEVSGRWCFSRRTLTPDGSPIALHDALLSLVNEIGLVNHERSWSTGGSPQLRSRIQSFSQILSRFARPVGRLQTFVLLTRLGSSTYAMAQKYLTYLFYFISLSAAAVFPRNVNITQSDVQSQPLCENTPTSRECWGQYSIDTDWYNVIPNTGVTREYWLVAGNITLAPDASSSFGISHLQADIPSGFRAKAPHIQWLYPRTDPFRRLG